MLTPPLDRSGLDYPPDTSRRHIKPPLIRGPPEIHTYTDTEDEDEDKEEEPTDFASLREQLAALWLRLNNMDERVAESEIDRTELGVQMPCEGDRERGSLLIPRPEIGVRSRKSLRSRFWCCNLNSFISFV